MTFRTENRKDNFFLKTKKYIFCSLDFLKVGFYFGDVDLCICHRVKFEGEVTQSLCFGLQLNNWEPGDRAVSEHQRHYPNCRFVRGDRADNVSLAGAAATVSSQVPAGAPGLTSVSNPSMQQSDERLLTFVNWPSRIPVRPEQLAKAGFYYVGKEVITSTVRLG